MTNQSGLPGVTVDQSRIDDFMAGIYGVNHKANRKAYERGAFVIVAAAAYNMIKAKKKGRR